LFGFLCWRVSPEWFDIRLARWLSFAAAPAVLAMVGLQLSERAVSEVEAMTVFLAAAGVALSLVTLGVVIPMAERKPAQPGAGPEGGGM
jgi:hypothetical protein